MKAEIRWGVPRSSWTLLLKPLKTKRAFTCLKALLDSNITTNCSISVLRFQVLFKASPRLTAMCKFLYTSVLLKSSEMTQKILADNFFFPLLEKILKLRVLSTYMEGFPTSVSPTLELGRFTEQHACQRPHCTASSVHTLQWASQFLRVFCSLSYTAQLLQEHRNISSSLAFYALALNA